MVYQHCLETVFYDWKHNSGELWLWSCGGSSCKDYHQGLKQALLSCVLYIEQV